MTERINLIKRRSGNELTQQSWKKVLMIMQWGTLFFSFSPSNRKRSGLTDWKVMKKRDTRFLVNRRKGKTVKRPLSYCYFWAQSFILHYPWSYAIILERTKRKANPSFSQNYGALSKPTRHFLIHDLKEIGKGGLIHYLAACSSWWLHQIPRQHKRKIFYLFFNN